MGSQVFIAHADGDEDLAGQLADRIGDAGYQVECRAFALVGASLIALESKFLRSGGPVILCGTRSALGSISTGNLIQAAIAKRVPLLPAKMEADANMSLLIPNDLRIADCATNFESGVGSLLDALAEHFPAETIPIRPAQSSSEPPNFLDTIIPFAQVDKNAVKRFRSDLRPDQRLRFPPDLSDNEFLARCGVMNSRQLTSAGLLMFGRHPETIIPHSVCHCTVYSGTNKVAQNEPEKISGTIFDQIQKIYDFVSAKTGRREAIVPTSAAATEIYEYPMLSVREIVANALVHRTYEDKRRKTHVRIFSECIEILSPGKWSEQNVLHDGTPVRLNELISEPISNNPRLASLLSWTRLVEGEGSGLVKSVDECQRLGAQIPTVKYKDGYISVTIFPNPAWNNIGDEAAQALKGLTTVTSLDLSGNKIGDKGAQALKGLAALTSLNLANNDIGDEGAQVLKGLIALTNLNLSNNDIGDEGAQALKGLSALTILDLSNNKIRNVSALASLSNLREINLSDCHLESLGSALWTLPSLQKAFLHNTSLPGVPTEILSESAQDNCLPRLRAHLADLSGEDVAVSDIKVMFLGNGRVGKTQICRQLLGERFDETVPSTHGIQIGSVSLAPEHFHTAAKLTIWDFGGQDIYRGTHALFLKSRAIFPIVWTPKSEVEQFHTHGGFTFRNQPLAYWLAYVRTFGGARSPVLVIQSQCDRPEDERDPPLPPGALDGFGFRKILHYSAKGDGANSRGHAALEESLLDAVGWMRQNGGVAKIGAGRAAVKEALEAMLAAGQRLISYQRYLDICAEVEQKKRGRISDPALLLEYLHNIGTLFYRKGLFGDQIILDQAWALDVVYAVFDRASQSFKKIERNYGRFRRSELAEGVWQRHGVPEQELFLSFMQQCGICFAIQEEDRDKRIEAEYIAPDLLPARSYDETQKRLKLVWDEAAPDTEAVLTFALLPPALMRAVIARIGSDAGLAAEYWRDGVCFYDEATASRALIEQRWTEGWAGEVHIATKRGNAGALLQRLIALVEDDRISLGARPSGKRVTGVEAKTEAHEASEAKVVEVSVHPAYEPSKGIEYYLSYAWGDDTMEGKEREAVVDRLCSEAEALGCRIVRDKTAMKLGDRISTFMDRIGKGVVNGRVCIVLSDKYLKSPYCMHELFDVWRNCREHGGSFIERTRVLVLPSAKISTPADRAQYVIHWQHTFRAFDDLVRQHGPFVLSDKDNAEYRLMTRFVNETANVLQLVQDTLRPRSFDDYVNHVFD